MTPENADSLLERRGRALVRLDQGHRALMDSLAGLDAQEAFLGSRWSVREVLLHLDSENFVDALEKIAKGEQDMLPPFSSMEEQLQSELAHLEDTHSRFRAVVSGLTAEQLSQLATPPNLSNSFPGLTLLELVERVSGHEATHSRQIGLTRKYVEAFRSREHAVSIITLGDGSPYRLPEDVRGLLNQADYVAGKPDALAAVRQMVRGVELTITEDNSAEIVSRLAREARAGIWGVMVCLGDSSGEASELIELAGKHADAVAIY